MEKQTREKLEHIFSLISGLDHIRPEDIPSIELYMDQVTTFMENQLNSTRRYPDDKILTKTMINNYAKNKLLPPPEKKKYTDEHILLLVFIYYFKNILSINDIQTLLDPITEKFFHGEAKDMSYIYEEVFSLEKNQIERLKKDLMRSFHAAESVFKEEEGEDREYLVTFSFICLLSFDVYLKKMMIERLIDRLRPEEPAGKGGKKKKS
ncbi:MAG: DUF1836 domain-containing protein [Clostridiales bacterium]|nr:DUF1836 domain-containing protein [Candidatus Blautia equi]